MGTKTRPALYWLSLLVYGLLLSGVLLYVRYPTAKFEEYLSQKILELTNGVEIEIDNCRYGFPDDIHCDRLKFSSKDKGAELIVLENIMISPVIAGLGFKYSINGYTSDGRFSSVVEILPKKGMIKVNDLELIDVDLGRLAMIGIVFQREILGKVDFQGSVTFSTIDEHIVNVKGEMSVDKGSFALRQPILLMDRLQMEPFEVKIFYENGVLKLTDGIINGKQLKSAFTGDLVVKNTIAGWDMNIQGNIVPTKEYMAENLQLQRVVKRLQRQFQRQDLPYRVSGSLTVPRFRFGNQ